MNMVPNENTFQGLSNGSNPNMQSAAVMEKISNYYKTTCAMSLKTIETMKIEAKVNHRFHFFPSAFQLVKRLLRMEGIAVLEAMTPRRAVNSISFPTVTSNNAHD